LNTLREQDLTVRTAEDNVSVSRAVFALEAGLFRKIICGASYTNYLHIERIATIYSLCGADAIDVAPDKNALNSARKGIKTAKKVFGENKEQFPNFVEPILMISVNAGGDVHFRKAIYNPLQCKNCNKCLDVCPSKAISKCENSLIIDNSSCYGCGRCAESCDLGAIEMENSPEFADIELENIDAIEVHTGKNSVQEVKTFLEFNSTLFKNAKLLSFCIESGRFSAEELNNYVEGLISLVTNKPIIQIDGKPMGATDKPCSSLQAVSAGAALLEKNHNAYIQLSGGVNNYTQNLAKMLNLHFSGLAFGTFARKIVFDYINEEDERLFLSNLQRIVNITTKLVGF